VNFDQLTPCPNNKINTNDAVCGKYGAIITISTDKRKCLNFMNCYLMQRSSLFFYKKAFCFPDGISVFNGA
jgi:hypothetical protein